MEDTSKNTFRISSDAATTSDNSNSARHRDINDLPVEVLSMIFKYCVKSNSASCLVSSFYHVSSLWRSVVETPSLWNEIPRDKNMTINMFLFLSKKDLLLNTTGLSLHSVYERDHSKMIQLFQNCPSLKSMRFERGTVNGAAVISLFESCPEVESLTFTQTHECFTPGYYSDHFLRIGSHLKCINLHDIYLKNGLCFFQTMAQFCPNLEELRVGKLKGDMKVFPVEPFQISCSKLSIMVLHDMEILTKKLDSNHGFTGLISFSYNREIESRTLFQLLGKSTHLKFLNIGYSPNIDFLSICYFPFIDLQVFCMSHSKPFFSKVLKVKWPNLEFLCITDEDAEFPLHIQRNLHPNWINYV